MAITYVGGNGAGGSNSAYDIGLENILIGGEYGDNVSPATGDLVICAFATSDTSDVNLSINTAGYTEVSDLFSDDVNDTNLSVNYKFMGATPDTKANVDGSLSSSIGASCAVMVFRGVDPVTPMDVTRTEATGIDTSRPTPPDITPATTGADIVICGSYGSASQRGLTKPTGWSTQFTAGNDPGTYSGVGLCYKPWTGGTVTPGQWPSGSSSTSDAWAAVTMALRPYIISGPANLKSYNTNLLANIKTINTNVISNVKSLNTNA